MIFKDMDLDFDIFDAETADIYEAAMKKVQSVAVKVPDETLGRAITRQCESIFSFFDDLFGENFHRDLFGERTNLMECIGVFKDFILAVEAQKKALDEMVADLSLAGNGNGDGNALNRAGRRAMVKLPK